MFNIRTGLGYDRHPFSETGSGPLKLGCVSLDFDRSLKGHSDGDVIAHSIADALLSAAGLPDLGTTFPAGCSSTTGIAGADILRWTARMVSDQGWKIGNIDCVVVCDTPTLKHVVQDMVLAISQALGIETSQVSIKPRHAEGLGFAGQNLGIESTSIVLLHRD